MNALDMIPPSQLGCRGLRAAQEGNINSASTLAKQTRVPKGGKKKKSP